MAQQILKFLVIVSTAFLAISTRQVKSDQKPQWQRVLGGDDGKKAEELETQIEAAAQADKYDEAIQLHAQLLALRTSAQGADHWQTVNARWGLEAERKMAVLSVEQRAGWRKVVQGTIEDEELRARGAYAKAQPLREEYNRCCRQVFGEKHANTAVSYLNLAANLYDQGKPVDAQPLFEHALGLLTELLGTHPETANCYGWIARVFNEQGKYSEAEPFSEKRLDMLRELYGERSVDTARAYEDSAMNLTEQGKYVEAHSLHLKALSLFVELRGEQDVDTALGYHNLAYNLLRQRKYAEALPLNQKALELYRALLGENHENTWNSYSNLASNLDQHGQHAEAQPFHEKALAIAHEVYGEQDARTASSYNSLALNLNAQGKHAEAQLLFQKSLAIRRELLGENHPQTLVSYNNVSNALLQRIYAAEQADQYGEAIQLREELLAMRIAAQGADHWEAVNERWWLTAERKIASLSVEQRADWRNVLQGTIEAQELHAKRQYTKAQPLWEEYIRCCRQFLGEKHRNTAVSYFNLAVNLHYQGKALDALPLFEHALDLLRELLGTHPETANCYSQIARILHEQGNYREAQSFYERSLQMFRELFGERHPDTASAYDGLALNLTDQGKCIEAQSLHSKALDLFLALRGENDVATALAYHNLAYNLLHQRKYAEALSLNKKALQLNRALHGEKHENTWSSYNNLASNFDEQGKHGEAQSLYERALDIAREMYGNNDAHTAYGYNNLAASLNGQGKYAEAQLFYQKALDLRRELLGEKHPETLVSYNNVAYNLVSQGEYVDAEPIFQRVLDLRRQSLGEMHLDTAASYNNLAYSIDRQGKHAAAQPLYEEALDLRRALLGELHPDTSVSYYNLAYNLTFLGRHGDAEPLLVRAADAYEAGRSMIADRGVDRAALGARQSPYPLLAATEAHLGAASQAWLAAERDLARGLLDEVASRRFAALPADERDHQAVMAERLSELQALILQLVVRQSSVDQEQDELRKLKDERRSLENKLAELAVANSRHELAAVDNVQAAIPADAAVLLWVDVNHRSDQVWGHWGCVARTTGEPHWERLTGTGPGGTWTIDDWDVPRRLTAAAASNASAADIAHLAGRLYAQRFAPLEKHLTGIKRLFVVPVNRMAGIPLEIVTDKFTVSYVPSGTWLARLKKRPHSTGTALLAIGDPVFPHVELAKECPLPPGGLLITQVVPGSNAAQARCEAGDVLFSYAGIQLSSAEQLAALMAEHVQNKSIAVTVWREGKTTDHELSPGELGVAVAPLPAPDAVVAKRAAEKLLLAVSRGGEWAELPGTAVEIARLKLLAGDDRSTILTRSTASEQQLEQLRASGELARFRYLHFATHGEPNNARSFESALILSQDNLSDEIPVDGGKYYDGRLTANEVLENWQLNADLVTLSACESALGRPGGGDGLLGFAQAFLLAGARSVCLSLWKVDDTATALLMDRFYQNLLGKREGLSQPMPKAEALAEAKHWLRNLTTDEATKLTADLTAGVARGKGETPLKLVVPDVDNPDSAADNQPFAHPRYWAAFILIGDPN